MSEKLKNLLRKVFRREPTLWFAVIAGAINLLVTFNLDFLSAEQASLWIALVNAVFGAAAAWRTRPIAPQVFTYVVSSVLGIAGAYGAHLSQSQVGQLNLLVLAILALLTRNQVSPVEDAHMTGVLGPEQ